MSTMGANVIVQMGVRRRLTRIIVAVCITSQMGMINALTDGGRSVVKAVGQ